MLQSLQLGREVTDQTRENIRRLAGVLKLDYMRLQGQFDDVRPLAQRHQREGVTTSEAWRLAVVDVSKTARTRALHPVEVLTAALARYVAWNASTTGIERIFGKTLCASSLARGDVGEQRMSDDVQLMSAQEPARDLATCERARAIWHERHGPPRSSPKKKRLDAGKTKGANPSSEAPSLKRRREGVANAAASIDMHQCAVPQPRVVGDDDGWEAGYS